MTFHLLLSSIIIGFCVAAPVGPVGILCIRRTFAHGFECGIVSGLGAAAADAIYAAIAAFGLTFISDFLMREQLYFRLFGGILLLYFGVKTFIAHPKDMKNEDIDLSLWRDFVSMFVLTATSPMTVIIFAGIFASVGLHFEDFGVITAALIVAGVFCGSCAWWLSLCGTVAIFKSSFNDFFLNAVNKVSGSIIFLFGLVLAIGYKSNINSLFKFIMPAGWGI